MLIFALLTSCALFLGSLALDEAGPLAPGTSDAGTYDLLSRAPMITTYSPERHPDRGSLPADQDKWAECAYDQDSEKEDDSGDEDVQSHSLAVLPWLRPTESRVSPHLERPSRSVPVLKLFSILRC
jgi:hypothetical protein